MEPTAKSENKEVEVTPEMIEAGYRALAESGLKGDDLLEADRLIVVEIYLAMTALRPPFCSRGK